MSEETLKKMFKPEITNKHLLHIGMFTILFLFHTIYYSITMQTIVLPTTISGFTFYAAITVLFFRDSEWTNSFVVSFILPMFLIMLQDIELGDLKLIHIIVVIIGIIILLFSFPITLEKVIFCHVVLYIWYWGFRFLGLYDNFYFYTIIGSSVVWVFNFLFIYIIIRLQTKKKNLKNRDF